MKITTPISNNPIILITNDDGIHAEGLHTLVKIASNLGDVYVVAPDRERSAASHSITIYPPLKVKSYEGFQSSIKKAWACASTPVDCVRLALGKLLPRTPDLCLSGINHGGNLSIANIYSGTVGAAVGAAIEGIPSIAFSLVEGKENFNFSYCKKYVEKIITKTFSIKNQEKYFCLSVNIPNVENIKGIQLVRQCLGRYIESFQEGTDPENENYYWIPGNLINHEENKEDTDISVTSKKYISITPIKILDTTDYSLLQKLKQYDTF
ncbi:MAG: 5'/3'-nucleotidase SurE [Chitinophagaceae bacterium]